MSESWRQTELPSIAASLATRPGHETVRVHMADILRHAFGAQFHELGQEVRLPEVHGRIDTLFGRTVLEFKRDLRQELGDVERRMPDYLAERQRQTGHTFIGIATDGATFIAYELRGSALVEFGRHTLRPDQPAALLAWLEPALSDRDGLIPEPFVLQRELGRESLTYGRAIGVLSRLWIELHSHPEVALKRQLWDNLLREVYGTPVGDDSLFLQHTYLTIVAKTIAARVLDLPANEAAAILSGRALADAGIHGAVEADFFDWVLHASDGRTLVERIARQAARFRLQQANSDVLKALYESLIDPSQRHDLGEYYTPDWLAARVTAAAVTDPLRQRVLDPACGSGTFLFHSIRRLLAAADAAGWSPQRALGACVANVRGMDIHPVAVIFARVTWLLALRERVLDREGDLHVPVYLGDALQWNRKPVAGAFEVVVPVPDDRPLHVPMGFAESQDRFDPGLQMLTNGLTDAATPEMVVRDLRRIAGVSEADVLAMGAMFAQLQALYNAGRDGIWPFVLRNLVRPFWLSSPGQQADVVIGNPPWVAFRHLSAEMQTRLRDACEALNLWVGGVLATQQDICALFWARAAQYYLEQGGTIAFVLPYAALNRPAYAGLRRGEFGPAMVRIVAGWGLDGARPMFPTSACVLFGRRERPDNLPAQITRLFGNLRRRDATEAEADADLGQEIISWPSMPTLLAASPYRVRFKNGASIFPRRFFIVERMPGGRLGQNRAAPMLRGREGKLDKRPWTAVTPPRGPVEEAFVRPVLLGETIAPFRILTPALGVIPLDGSRVLDASAAAAAGHRHLAAWLRDIEAKWVTHCNRRPDGTPRVTLSEQIDHMRKLSQQYGAEGPKIVYAKAGTLLNAAIVQDDRIVIDHKAYWARARSLAEGRYVVAVVNSPAVLARVVPMQPRGWRDARDFDNLVWELPIPEFDPSNSVHTELAELGAEAELVAANVVLDASAYYMTQRRSIRDALASSGISERIDLLVQRLLES